ncbi:WG repeat-containing protein [Clostridium aminobutyricum]|uniref:WG repeat-containing protein n=1 Tax=Clostridium aminobutyricum TaxID=33953 RepID=A0A939II89_CLOAM|nr:WG repeat-containing protein [Clostridium aminobutyricum]MBN7772318.1 WG repeat-containing protein [Clostridium aminobutyricum]
MRYKSKVVKTICCMLAITVVFRGFTGNIYADTKGQKSVEDMGVDITWYDFGKDCTNYTIQDDSDTGIYMLNISNNSASGKTAFVNGKGEIVLQPETYDGYSSSVIGEETVTLMRKGDQYIYIDSSGTKEIDGKAYSDVGPFMDGYATVTLQSNAHKGVMDKNGKLLFEDKEGKYTEFRFLGNGIFSAAIEGGVYDLVDTDGRPLSDAHYGYSPYISEETIQVSKDAKYGFLDLSGTEIVPLIYDYAFPFYEGFAAVSNDKKWGFIDKTGKEVISQSFDEVRSFHNGLAIVSRNNRWGIIDKTGTIILPIEYDSVVKNEQGFFDARKDSKSFLIDSSGEVVSTKDYSFFDIESNNRIYVKKTIHNMQVSGYLDKDETMLTGFKDFNLRYLSDNLYLGAKPGADTSGGVAPHDYDQRFALLDANGNNLTGFKYSNTGDFFHDFQVVYKYYFEGVGLVNQYGAEVLPTIFNNILLTDEGYAFVTISDPDSGANARVGYFKIPDTFSEKKGAKPITVYVDGIELYFESEPVIKNQSTMVPMRKFFEVLGAEVKWDNKTRTATASMNGKEIRVSIGSEEAYIDGSKIQLLAAPFIQDDITLVPLRFVSENSGADVRWDGDARRVMINSDNQ